LKLGFTYCNHNAKRLHLVNSNNKKDTGFGPRNLSASASNKQGATGHVAGKFQGKLAGESWET